MLPDTALARVIDALDVVAVHGDPDVVVTGVAYDSRQVVAGDLFCCALGAIVDGHDFADSAIAAGAVALLVERRLPVEVPQVEVADVRVAMAIAAATVFGSPSTSLDVVGVTGTNGKTTVTHLLEAMCSAGGANTGLEIIRPEDGWLP